MSSTPDLSINDRIQHLSNKIAQIRANADEAVKNLEEQIDKLRVKDVVARKAFSEPLTVSQITLLTGLSAGHVRNVISRSADVVIKNDKGESCLPYGEVLKSTAAARGKQPSPQKLEMIKGLLRESKLSEEGIARALRVSLSNVQRVKTEMMLKEEA